MSKKSVKSLIVLGWLCIFILFCYSPYLTPKLTDTQTLSILTWGDILDPDVIAEFEKTHHIKVHMSFYGSNEELLVKMKATKGQGYDLLIPSDYAVAKLIEYDLLGPLDKTLLPQAQKIDPLILNQFYDPHNLYSLPFEWEVFGFGYNQNKLPLEQASWDLLFNPDLNFKYVMANDPNEAIQFASFYLFGPKIKLDPSELSVVIDLLSTVRARTEAYASFRSDYFLATDSVPLVVASSSYIWRSIKNYPHIHFKIPDEGSFMTIENLCLSKECKNRELAHKLINFLYSDASMKKHFETYHFFPSTLHQIPDMKLEPAIAHLIETRDTIFKKLSFIHELSTQQKIQDAWVKIKVSSLP
jgi:spermidine/putrescine transport system substrate-binding protein